MLLLFSGILGASIATCYINKTLKYSFTIKFLSLVSTTTFASIIIILNFYPSFYLMLMIIFLLGILITPLYPLTYDFSCEIAFPVG